MASVQTTARRPVAGDVIVDQRARLEAAFDRQGTALYRYLVVRTGGDRHLADDLMQQVWLQLRGAADRTQPIPDDELEFWMRGIARNLVRDHWRRVRKRPKTVPMPEPHLAAELADRMGNDELPVRILERHEVRDQLVLALTALPTADQELIVGRYFQGRSHTDLAADLGISVRAVEGRLYRARRVLLEVLANLGA